MRVPMPAGDRRARVGSVQGPSAFSLGAGAYWAGKSRDVTHQMLSCLTIAYSFGFGVAAMYEAYHFEFSIRFANPNLVSLWVNGIWDS